MSPPVNNASSHIQWQVIRKNSVFLKRQRGIPKTFSTEPFNPKKINSIRFNGLINKKAVDVKIKYNKTDKNAVEAIVLTTKVPKNINKPAKSMTVNTFNRVKLPKQTVKKVKALVKNYKPSVARHVTVRTSKYLRTVKPTGKSLAMAAKAAAKTEA